MSVKPALRRSALAGVAVTAVLLPCLTKSSAGTAGRV